MKFECPVDKFHSDLMNNVKQKFQIRKIELKE